MTKPKFSTIQFYCPNCKSAIGFKSIHIGKKAKCISCSQKFIIPGKEFVFAEKISDPKPIPEAVPGFYRAAFVDNWNVFFKSENLLTLFSLLTALCFKFFTSHLDYSMEFRYINIPLPVGLIITIFVWGFFFWFYMETIQITGAGFDDVPDIEFDSFIDFTVTAFKSVVIFAFTFAMVMLPSVIAGAVLRSFGVESKLVSQVLSYFSIALLPVAILTASAIRTMDSVFNTGQIIKAVIKTFWPYFSVSVFLYLAWTLQFSVKEYGQLQDSGFLVISAWLLIDIAVNMLGIICIRALGLYYRHYASYFPW